MEQTRSVLAEKDKPFFDDIVFQRVLGASKHIQMIGEMFRGIALQAADSKQMMTDIKTVGEYFIKTRGEASRAVCNAVKQMFNGMNQADKASLPAAQAMVIAAADHYGAQAVKNNKKIVNYGLAIAKPMKQILVFDYSSTVNAFINEWGQMTEAPGGLKEIVIPESRSINGGYAFAATALAAGLKVHFIPDGAMLFYLRTCDAAFIGAETFYADGTAFNTTGSDLLGMACRDLEVPLYVMTPMIKLDSRPIYGFQREHVMSNLRKRFEHVGFREDEAVRVDFQCPELLPVPNKYIEAFITEYGIIPTNALFQLSLEYEKSLTGGAVK